MKLLHANFNTLLIQLQILLLSACSYDLKQVSAGCYQLLFKEALLMHSSNVFAAPQKSTQRSYFSPQQQHLAESFVSQQHCLKKSKRSLSNFWTVGQSYYINLSSKFFIFEDRLLYILPITDGSGFIFNIKQENYDNLQCITKPFIWKILISQVSLMIIIDSQFYILQLDSSSRCRDSKYFHSLQLDLLIQMDNLTQKLKRCVCLSDFREVAKTIIDPAAFQYIDSGSEDEKTLRENQISFHKHMIIPRILISTAKTDLSKQIWGKKFNLPFGFAPWAMNIIVHPKGEIIPANVAYKNNIMYCLSTLSTKSYSELAEANKDGIRLMQMYISNDWALTQSLIRLAQKYGFTGLAITVDAQVLGLRKRETKTSLDSSNIVFPVLQEILSSSNSQRQYKQRKSMLQNRDLSMNWQTIKKIRSMTKLKIILKGIMHPKDAQIAVQFCDAIWISNHGGRQLDGVSSTINILPLIKQAVGIKIPIFIDGGIRTGNDIFKCLAFGADYIFVGRPVAFSLSLGEEGVIKMVKILEDQLKRAMVLVGCQQIKDINIKSIVPDPNL